MGMVGVSASSGNEATAIKRTDGSCSFELFSFPLALRYAHCARRWTWDQPALLIIEPLRPIVSAVAEQYVKVAGLD
jgi:hypothetical protein